MPQDRLDTQNTLHSHRPGLVRLPAVELCVTEGPDQGLSLRIGGEQRFIGTADGCHLKLSDRTVSRIHCSVESRPEGIVVADRTSTNGTFVNGVRVHAAYLTGDTTLRLGDTTIQVVAVQRGTVLPLSSQDSFGKLLGGSRAMRRVYAVLDRVAASDTTVLVTGETGTGKELVARELHRASSRANGPFVVVDCGAIPDNLMESELFGHVRGAFTGANSNRAGVFEEADGGTLFFDEIGELPIALQPKLLRVLETRSLRRLGSTQTTSVDVRIVSATHRSLADSVNDGSFREDLYYRLAVIEIGLPSLRARREDIPRLAQHFLQRYGAPNATLPESVAASLARRHWSGNVRELRNYIQRALHLGWDMAAGERSASLSSPPDPLNLADLPFKEARDIWIERFESVYTKAVLEKTDGNVSRAAELAGINRRSLHRIIARLGIKDDAPDD